MMYIDYEYYTNHCGKLPREDFNAYIHQACAYINRITYSRLIYGAEVTDSVKMAVGIAIDILKGQATAREKYMDVIGLKSESGDGYSVTYQDQKDFDKQCERQLNDAVSVYLPLSHPLRYAGV